MQRVLSGVLIGVGLGALIGVLIGWLVPVQDVSAGFSDLHPAYKLEYTIMVGAAYAVDGDWDLAQARLGRLAEPDPAVYLVQVTEQAISEGRRPDDIRHLVRMAERFGYTTPAMIPYLSPQGDGS